MNGKVAIDVMKKAAMEGKTYDLALVDYQMAEMDGLDFAREVKKDPQIANTKLILLSSVSNILAKGKEKEAGFEAYLNKPIKLKQFIQCYFECNWSSSRVCGHRNSQNQTCV